MLRWSTTSRSTPSPPARAAWPARSDAQSPSACRSAAPRRVRAPVSSRTSASPRVGSWTTCSVESRSTTSGVDSRPPRPTTSTGRPSARSACRTAENCERLRHRTAAVGGVADERQCCATNRATACASRSTVSATTARTRPGPAPGRAASGATGVRSCARSGAAIAFATSRTAWSLRHDVESWCTSAGRQPDGSRPAPPAGPASVGKSVGNRDSPPALAPRQP